MVTGEIAQTVPEEINYWQLTNKRDLLYNKSH